MIKQQNDFGFAMTEVVVAASLLMTGMAIVVPMILRGHRLQRETELQTTVIDELSSQLERLTHLDRTRRIDSLGELRIAEHLANSLPSAQLDAKVIDDQQGERIVVSLDWQRLGDPPPVSLVGWIATPSIDAVRESEAQRTTKKND